MRRRRRVVKLAEYAKARWFFGRGFPTAYIAARLRVSPVTVRYWRRLCPHDHIFAQIQRRALLLPDWRREQLITTLVDARVRT